MATVTAKERYLSGEVQKTRALIAAAQDHVGALGDDGRVWLYRKPFHAKPHNREFFDGIYPVLGAGSAFRRPSPTLAPTSAKPCGCPARAGPATWRPPSAAASPGCPGFSETGTRFPMPKHVWPGERADLYMPFVVSEGPGISAPWFLDLVSEQVFWFSLRGTEVPGVWTATPT